jgi:hypothetical protein
MCNKYIFELRTAVLCLATPRDGDNPQINCTCINKNSLFHTVSLYLDKDTLYFTRKFLRHSAVFICTAVRLETNNAIRKILLEEMN